MKKYDPESTTNLKNNFDELIRLTQPAGMSEREYSERLTMYMCGAMMSRHFFVDLMAEGDDDGLDIFQNISKELEAFMTHVKVQARN